MSLNQSNFLHCLDSLESFISDRGLQTDKYVKFHKPIAAIKAFLDHQNKLVLQVVATSNQQIEAFNNLISEQVEITKLYEIKTNLLPQITPAHDSGSFPTLVLENSSESFMQYELKNQTNYIIGRNRAIADILLPDHLGLISGNHAQLQRTSENQWQIKDSGSLNGTFINDSSQKLEVWHTLKAGDKICLGSDSQASESATFIFQLPSEEEINSRDSEIKKLFSCHILCLILPSQSFLENIQHFFRLIKEAHIPQILVIIERPANIDCNSFQTTVQEIENTVKNHISDVSFTVKSLVLNFERINSDATVIIPHAQTDFEAFCNHLKQISPANLAEIIIQSTTYKLKQLLTEIDDSLSIQEAQLIEQIKQEEELYQQLSQNNLKKEMDKVCKQVDQERDLFFKQIKTELNQSKGYLLDEFRQQSISTKITDFTQQLEAQSNYEKGFRHICLRLPLNYGDQQLSTVHHQAINLCHGELGEWITTQWQKICHEYEDGGLVSLWHRSYHSLNFIPEIQLPSEKFVLTQNLEIDSIFKISTLEQHFEIKYKQPNFFGYMLKNVRGQIISIGGLIGMISGGAFSKGILVPVLFPILMIILWFSYKQDQTTKVEESIEKLQKQATNYYQSYVKTVIDRLTQYLDKLLDLEDRNIKSALEEVKEIYATYLAEIELNQRQLKTHIDEMKRYELKDIQKDFINLQKLKQSLSLL